MSMNAAAKIQKIEAPCRAVTSPGGGKQHFFGYYDKFPWDASGRYLLALETAFLERPPTGGDMALAGMVDLQEENAWTPLAETSAWCWQQGTMLQWMPSAPGREIIYNDREGDRFVARVRDVFSGRTRTLPRPIYALSPDGRWALSLNFARVARTRPGYGYAGLPDPSEGEDAPEDDGIWFLDLPSGEHRLILSLATIKRLRPSEDMEGAEHWFNHLTIAPDAKRWVGLHRWKTQARQWRTRLFSAGPGGSDLHIVSDHEMVSHYAWRDPRHILAWARRRGRGDHFFLFPDRNDREDRIELIGGDVLTQDGHCTYSPDGQWILTDTYPGKERKRILILYRLPGGPRIEIGRFYAPPELDGEIRCDLHPRWSRDGKQVCMDSAHEGSRQVYVLDVSGIVAGAE